MMAKKRSTFTVRLEDWLLDQIEQRSVVNRRSRNAEINHLIQKALSDEFTSDQKTREKIAQQIQGEEN